MQRDLDFMKLIKKDGTTGICEHMLNSGAHEWTEISLYLTFFRYDHSNLKGREPLSQNGEFYSLLNFPKKRKLNICKISE